MRHHTLAEAVTYGHGNERPFLCPVHGDSRPSASVNMAKKVWLCYTCGARGKLSGELLAQEPDYLALKEWYEKKLEAARVYPESWLARWDAGDPHPYWLHRVGAAAAAHFRLGYDPERNAVTYPLRDPAGRVLGVVRRALDGGGPKYLYPAGVDVGRLLFNYTPTPRRTVVLVEGALDAIALWRSGVTAFAIYGARLGAEQVNLIDRLDPIYIYTAYDNDNAGFSAHCQTERAFPHRAVGRLTWPASWGKDIDEIGQDHRDRVVSVLARTDESSIDSSLCRSSASASTRTPPTRTCSTTSPRSRLSIRRSAT